MAGGLSSVSAAGEFGSEAPLDEDLGEHGGNSEQQIARINAEFAIRNERIQQQKAQQQQQQAGDVPGNQAQGQQPQQPPQQQGAAPGQQPQPVAAEPQPAAPQQQPAAPAPAQQPAPQPSPQMAAQQPSPQMAAQQQLIKDQQAHRALLEQQMKQAQRPNQLDAFAKGFLENKGKGGFGGLLGGLMGMSDAKTQSLAKQMDISKMRMELAMKQAQSEGDLVKMEKLAQAEQAADNVFTVDVDTGAPKWDQKAANQLMRNNPELARQTRSAFEHAEAQHEQKVVQSVIGNAVDPKTGQIDNEAMNQMLSSARNPNKMKAEIFKTIAEGRKAGVYRMPESPEEIAAQAQQYTAPGLARTFANVNKLYNEGKLTPDQYAKRLEMLDKQQTTHLSDVAKREEEHNRRVEREEQRARERKEMQEDRQAHQRSMQAQTQAFAQSLRDQKGSRIDSEHAGKALNFGVAKTVAADTMDEYERRNVRINVPEAIVNGLATDSKGNITGLAGQYMDTLTPHQRGYMKAANEFVVAKLRKESGAAINKDEYIREFEQVLSTGRKGDQDRASEYRHRNAALTLAQTGLNDEALAKHIAKSGYDKNRTLRRIGGEFGDKQPALPAAGETVSVQGGIKIKGL